MTLRRTNLESKILLMKNIFVVSGAPRVSGANVVRRRALFRATEPIS
jgi:hypothetical protein